MLLKNGQRFKDDGFRGDAGVSYPAGYAAKHPELWAELKITEVIPEQQPDPKYYRSNLDWLTGKWKSSPHDIDSIKKGMIADAKRVAHSMLAPSDWRIIREVETDDLDDTVQDEWLAFRTATRARSNAIETDVNDAETIEDLQEANTGDWPESPDAKAVREEHERLKALEEKEDEVDDQE